MEIKLSEFEVEKLKEIVIYFLEVPRKLWKQHYDYVNDLRTINLSVDLSLNDAQEKALIECLHFFIYNALPFWNYSVEPHCSVAEDVLFKKLKQKQYCLISNKYRLWNEKTGQFEYC